MSAEVKMTGSQLVVVAVRGGTLSTRSCIAKTYAGAFFAETGQLRGVSADMLSYPAFTIVLSYSLLIW